MASEAKGAERAYAEIKRAILAGELRLKERLDIEALARSLKLSTTPVRYALTRLDAERLVAAQGARGYFVAMWSERELRALYEWRGALALLALSSWRGEGVSVSNGGPHEDRLAHALCALEADANAELVRAAAHASERLRPALAAEGEVLPESGGELEALEAAIAAGLQYKDEIASLIEAMFKARAEQSGAIRKRAAMRALPANGG
jgi:DNA-binding GntR family transcriptional regulator